LRSALAGASGNGRRIVQTVCASVLQVPISLGAIQKVLDRVAQAIAPHDLALAPQARHALGNSIDEPAWFCPHTLQWLWGMTSEREAFYLMHPHRATEACAALIDDWAGLLGSDGSGVSQRWAQARQPCLAPLLRTARGLAARTVPEVAACGTGALAERQRLCHRATAPPTGGAGRAWDARWCKWMAPSHDQPHDAGRCARRGLREMDSLGVLLTQQGVEPTHNRAERALRCGGLWRKRSLGTASTQGNRWGERILSRRETGRLRARATSTVLVDAVTSFFRGHPPALSWLT
jgi:transposase